jgi:hypothetical protein
MSISLRPASKVIFFWVWESLYENVREYVKFTGEAIGYDPRESVPWLFDEFGFSNAKAETL